MYLIAYDIADPGRLRRVARLMERHALRCQKSVFLFRGDDYAVASLLDQAAARMDLRHDVVQAWRVGSPDTAHSRGALLNLEPPAVVLAAGEQILLPPEHP